jgi:UDP-GlcNAc:undecaprenyl-phosphate GlcNAc-1-phosphate transferase
MILLGLQVFAVSAATAWLVTPLVIRLGVRWGAVDLPGPRKVHVVPIPRIGGVSVFLAFFAGLIYGAFASGFLPTNFLTRGWYWGSLAAAAAAIFAMGLFDDARGLTFRWKFAIQILTASTVWAFGFRIENLALPFGLGVLELGPFSIVATVLWIVAVTNALNLIDGLDGLAAGLALISTVAVAVIAFYRNQVAVTAAAVALVGSLIGFLPFNFSPARVLLGDSGSMLLGFVLAVLSIHAGQKGTTAVAVLAPILVIGVPLMDTSLAVLRRLHRLGSSRDRGEGRVMHFFRHVTVVFHADREHLHHRLIDLGLSQRSAVMTMYVFAIVTALAALSLSLVHGRALALLLFAVLGCMVTAFLLALTVARRREHDRRTRDARIAPVRTVPARSFKPVLRDTTASPPE